MSTEVTGALFRFFSLSFTVVSQAYDVKFWEEYVLRGNAAILKCQIPSFVAEYVSVSSWIISEDENEVEIKIDDSSDLGIRCLQVYCLHPPFISLSFFPFLRLFRYSSAIMAFFVVSVRFRVRYFRCSLY